MPFMNGSYNVILLLHNQFFQMPVLNRLYHYTNAFFVQFPLLHQPINFFNHSLNHTSEFFHLLLNIKYVSAFLRYIFRTNVLFQKFCYVINRSLTFIIIIIHYYLSKIFRPMQLKFINCISP